MTGSVAVKFVIFALAAACATPSPAEPPLSCRVAHVSDGDTFWARCPGELKVRLLLIDAPERDQPPFGRAAWTHLEELLPRGSAVSLELDVRGRDQYGRTLAYVYDADGRMVNEEMARAGYAVALVYPPNVRYVERIRAAAAEARAAKRGLWQTDGFSCTPRDHRQRRC